MKKTLAIIFALTLVGLAAVTSCAQFSRTNRISRPCPGTATPARVEVQADGDIDLVPCATRGVYINGVLTSNTITFSGSSRTNFFPVFSTETNLAKSPFGWDGTVYTWNNSTFNSEFTLDLTPSTASGLFRVGDFTTTPTNYLTLNQSTNRGAFAATTGIDIDSPLVIIGDVTGISNQVFLSVNNSTSTFTFASGGGDAIFNTAGVNRFQFLRTITAGGTTGDQIINRPSGTVNFAAGATALTVTNSTVSATSIVLAVARTNDANCAVKNVVSGAGSFVINMTAACAAETSVGFLVLN